MATRVFKSVEAFGKALRDSIEKKYAFISGEAIKLVVDTAYETLIKYSPSDTGNFRNSFAVSVDSPVVYSINDPPASAPSKGSAPTSEERNKSGIDSLSIDYSKANRIYITNGARSKASKGYPDGYGYYYKVEYTGWAGTQAYAPFAKTKSTLMNDPRFKGITIK